MSKNKITITIKNSKSRNTTIEILKNCKGGVHEKTNKAKRKASKDLLKKDILKIII